MRNAQNILQHELIGMEVKIKNTTLPEKSEISGTVVDETRNMLIVKHDQRDLKIPKRGSNFAFLLPADENQPENLIECDVQGEHLIARPEDRVKRNESKARRR